MKTIIKLILVIFFLVSGISSLADKLQPLTLPEAESLAVSNALELQRLHATSRSLEQQAIAEGQLPDPKLVAGAINVPTDTFSFNQDEMTMVGIGLEQSFPAGHSLAMKEKQTNALAIAEQRKIQDQKAILIQEVRETWLDLYYWLQAAKITRTNRALFAYLFKVTKSQYSVGKDNLSNVSQVQLELSHLDDQLAQIDQQIAVLRAQLGRWIGQNQANRSLAQILPHWPEPLPFNVLQDRLQQHPLLKIDAANIEAARHEVAFARELFKPGWTIDLDYGIRQGNMMGTNGMPTPRSDMVTAQVTVDLPVFTKNRQDRRLQANADQLVAVQLDQQIHYRDLLKDLTAQYALWQNLSQRENLYAKRLIPEAKQNSKAALLAYQSATTDLASVLRAYTNERTIKLEKLQVQVERAKVRAALFYLEGISQ